jgi:hypothetical protein
MKPQFFPFTQRPSKSNLDLIQDELKKIYLEVDLVTRLKTLVDLHFSRPS